MQINVNIILAPEDSDPVMSPDEMAHAILEAFNGDPEKDSVTSFVHRPAPMGSAGLAAEMAGPPPGTQAYLGPDPSAAPSD